MSILNSRAIRIKRAAIIVAILVTAASAVTVTVLKRRPPPTGGLVKTVSLQDSYTGAVYIAGGPSYQWIDDHTVLLHTFQSPTIAIDIRTGKQYEPAGIHKAEWSHRELGSQGMTDGGWLVSPDGKWGLTRVPVYAQEIATEAAFARWKKRGGEYQAPSAAEIAAVPIVAGPTSMAVPPEPKMAYTKFLWCRLDGSEEHSCLTASRLATPIWAPDNSGWYEMSVGAESTQLLYHSVDAKGTIHFRNVDFAAPPGSSNGDGPSPVHAWYCATTPTRLVTGLSLLPLIPAHVAGKETHPGSFLASPPETGGDGEVQRPATVRYFDARHARPASGCIIVASDQFPGACSCGSGDRFAFIDGSFLPDEDGSDPGNPNAPSYCHFKICTAALDGSDVRTVALTRYESGPPTDPGIDPGYTQLRWTADGSKVSFLNRGFLWTAPARK